MFLRTRAALVCAAFACLVTTAHADTGVSSFTLDNGMEAVVIQDNRAPVVVHMVWYRVGSADEPAGKGGIAHYLEHLMFKGTKTHAPGAFSRIIEANGGSENAFTHFDYTAYFQRVAANRLPLMMEMEADRMRNLVLDDADFATERDVVLEERAQRTDSSPGALLSEQSTAAQFLNHPYGRPIIGWRHEVAELTLQDALDFYAVHYAPNNAILVVAGDVDPAEVEALAKLHYGSIAPSQDLPPRLRPSEPQQLAPRMLKMQDARVANPYVIRSYLAPSRAPGDQRDAAALSLLATLLGGNSATSLMGQLLEQDSSHAIYTAAAYSATMVDDFLFNLIVMPTPGRSLEQAEADMDLAIKTFFEQGVDSEKLIRLKAQARASDIYARDILMERAQEYGRALATGLSVEDIEAWPAILQSITEDEIIAAARALFDPARSVTAYLDRPKPASEEILQ